MDVVSVHTDRVDMREHVIDFGKQHVITKDTVQIEIDALVVRPLSARPAAGPRSQPLPLTYAPAPACAVQYFRIADPRVAVFKVQNVPDNVELLTQATLRNIIAHMTLDDTFSSREQINDDLMSKVGRGGGGGGWGV